MCPNIINFFFNPQKRALFAWNGFFYLLNSFVFLILLSRYLKFVLPFETVSAKLYAPVTLIGQTFLFFTVFYITTTLLALMTGSARLTKAVGILTGLFFTVFLLVDFGVYDQYRFHLNRIVIDLVIGGGTEIFAFSSGMISYICFLMAGVFAIQMLNAWISGKLVACVTLKKKYIVLPCVTISLACVVAFNVINAWADVNFQREITRFSRHIPLFYPMTAKRFLQRHGFVDLAKLKDRNEFKIRKTRKGQMKYPVKPLSFGKGGASFNLLFIVLDCFRFDMLTPQITPHIHNFRQTHDTLNYTRHFSGGNGTRMGIFSLFYGIPGSYWNLMYEEQMGPLLMHEIVKRRYQTGIFASAKLTTPPFNRTVFNEIPSLRSFSRGDTAWERDINAVSEWLEWLDKADRNKPFFGFIFLDSAHNYTFPPGYTANIGEMAKSVDYHTLNNEKDPTPIKNRFKTSLHFTDSLIGKVLEDLQNRSLVQKTIIIITGDHGQEFNENRHNFWGHGSNFTKYQIQVPLVISWPGKKEKTYTHLSTHFDVSATLMKALFQCQNNLEDFTSGRSLFDETRREWFISGGFSKTAIVEKDRITVSFNTGTYEIFDKSYTEQKSAMLRPDVLEAVLKELSKFN